MRTEESMCRRREKESMPLSYMVLSADVDKGGDNSSSSPVDWCQTLRESSKDSASAMTTLARSLTVTHLVLVVSATSRHKLSGRARANMLMVF